ncbi:MAG: hypothetical protein ACSLEY_03445 [Candidatus Saccharimonadales bacterium]
MKTKLLIFGFTGDLSTRKLLPALRDIAATGKYNNLQIIGVSRRKVDIPSLLRQSVGSEDLVGRTTVFTMNLADAGDYQRLNEYVNVQYEEQLVVYLSVPPQAVMQIVDYMGAAGINTPNVKILFEKPFGVDRTSAEDMIARTAQYYAEDQLYRIDHYAAKEVAHALIRLRANAENHHHHWSRESITSIEVLATESIGIEGRAVFYEQTGALRDFVQGHLMQLLALILMDPKNPSVPEARLEALRQIKVADPSQTDRAQYEGYDEEVDNPGSLVETFVRVKLESNDSRWQGVPLTLLTGKALDEKRSQIVIHYHDGSKEVFDEARAIEPIISPLDAYERVLIEAIEGRKDIFTQSDEVLESWRILTPLQEAWAMDNVPLLHYGVGVKPDAIYHM